MIMNHRFILSASLSLILGGGGISPIHALAGSVTNTPAADNGSFSWETGVAGGFDGGAAFAEGDDTTFADTKFSTAVTVPDGIKAGAVTIGSGFSFTGATITAASLTKTGTGASSVANDLLVTSVTAAGGGLDAGNILNAQTVAVSNGAVLRAKSITSGMRFLRLSITKDGGNNRASVSEMRLFRAAENGYEKIEWPIDTKLTDCANESATYKGGSGTPEYSFDGGLNSDNSVKGLIDGIYKGGYEPESVNRNKWWPNGSYSTDNPQWVIIEFPKTLPMPCGYNLCTGDAVYNRIPKDWTVEISLDGKENNWKLVSQVTGAAGPGLQSWFKVDGKANGDKPAFLFDKSSMDVTAVSVAEGGTIVADGNWTANLTLADNAKILAAAGGCLTVSPSVTFGSPVTIDLTGYNADSVGKHYILQGNAADWPDVSNLTLTGAGGMQLLRDGNGYYVEIPSRALTWGPAADDTEKKWVAGPGAAPWLLDGANVFFRGGDAVTFPPLEGIALADVNVSGEVSAASAAFTAGEGQTAYFLNPVTPDARLVVTGKLTVAGLVTNGVPCEISGPATVDGTLVLAPAEGALQTFSGGIDGAGDIVKDGPGETELNGTIGSTGRLAVNAGTLTVDAQNQTVKATETEPITVGPGATLRFAGGSKNRLASGAWVLCDGGTVAFSDANLFPDNNRANFILTNNAVLKANQLNNRLGTLRIHNSRIVFPNSQQGTGIDVQTLTAGGDCGAAYEKGGNKKENIAAATVNVLEGGRFTVDVDMGASTKTGPGTLSIGKQARFISNLAVNEGILELPPEAAEFENSVTFANGTTIAVGGRTEAYYWGESLGVPQGVKVNVDVTGRPIAPGDVLLTWTDTATPAGEFALTGADGFSLKKSEADGLGRLEVITGGMIFILR